MFDLGQYINYLAFLLLLMLMPTSIVGQTLVLDDKSELSIPTSDQLKDWLKNREVKGDDEIAQRVRDELVRRLTNLPTDQLVACFLDGWICGAWENQASGWPISDEITTRGDPHELLVSYWNERHWEIRNGIEHVAYHFDSAEVTEFMRRVVARRINDGEDRYWPVNYLAKKCETAGLRELSSGRYRNQGSLQYQTSVALFGKCKYRPAIPYLVDVALYDFSYNIVIPADESLHALYPDHPEDFDNLEKVQRYYCSRARQEGFKVHCKLK